MLEEVKPSLPPLSIKPVRGEGVKYFSQMGSFPDQLTPIARYTCGITSAAMAISYAVPQVTPFDVLVRASSLHEVPANVTNYWLESNVDGRRLKIPLGTHPDAAA